MLIAIRHSWGQSEGMAVNGEGGEALEDLRRKRIDKQERSEVSADSTISLAFYTGGIGWKIELEQVERKGSVVTIRYRPIPYREAMSCSHLALIPVGKLPTGTYRVVVEQLPMEKKYEAQGFQQPSPNLKDRVSDSFAVVVIDRR
jgi:hypothetical protein